MAFDRNKFKNLVHYISHRCDNPDDLGSTKLNKILWYSDIEAYRFLGTAITGEVYKKHGFGPVPQHILSVLDELQDEGKIRVNDVIYYGRDKKEFVSLKKPDISMFSKKQKDIINKHIDHICRKHTATSISNKTHDRIWELATQGEEIPYEATLVAKAGRIKLSDIRWIKNKLREKYA
jgi:hypothetical protein